MVSCRRGQRAILEAVSAILYLHISNTQKKSLLCCDLGRSLGYHSTKGNKGESLCLTDFRTAILQTETSS